MSEDDKAQLMGFISVNADMTEWENHLEEKKHVSEMARQNAENEMRKVSR